LIHNDKVEELKKVFKDEGWRLHHFYKEGEVEKSYLSVMLAQENKNFLVTDNVTLSEKALLHVQNDKANYVLFFENENWVKAFNETCKDQWGITASDQKLQDAFLAAEVKGNADIWKAARQNLSIGTDAVKKEGEKGKEDVNVVKDVKDVKVVDKSADVKVEVKDDDAKPEA
jgi:hypothetical protein